MDVDMRTIVYFKANVCEAVNRIHLAENRVQWRALVNTVKNLRVP